MNWFRSNIGLGSRLALMALAIQFLMSFGHSHGRMAALAAAGPAEAIESGSRADIPLGARGHIVHAESSFAGAAAADTNALIRFKPCPRPEPADDCAICTVMALAHALVAVAAPPDLPSSLFYAPLRYATGDVGLGDPSPVRIAFQPRAPPRA